VSPESGRAAGGGASVDFNKDARRPKIFKNIFQNPKVPDKPDVTGSDEALWVDRPCCLKASKNIFKQP
jgi:hypothetical protein